MSNNISCKNTYELNWDEDEGRYLSDEEYWAKNPLLELENFEFGKDEEQPF